MADKTQFVKTTQSAEYGLPVGGGRGCVDDARGRRRRSSSTAPTAHSSAYTMLNYLCHDMQTVMDNTRPTDRIRQDVARSPGGDSRVFLNNCAGCHCGMDPMAQAFAYYDFSNTTNQLVYTAGQVQPKYLKNAQNFPWGFVTPDDSWSNRWRQGPNADLGWDPSLPGSGVGAAVSRPGAGEHRGVRQLPGGQGLPGGVLARADEHRRPADGIHDRSRLQIERLRPEARVSGVGRRMPGLLSPYAGGYLP